MKGKRSKTDQASCYPELLQRIHARLKEKNWNQSKLARKLGKDHGTVSRWLNNEHEMSVTSLVRVCEVLEIKLSHLFRDLAA